MAVCGANRLKYKGNWKLAYDNSATATTWCSRIARCWKWRTGRKKIRARACRITRASPTRRRCMPLLRARPPPQGQASERGEARGRVVGDRGAHPGMERYEAELRQRLGQDGDRALDLAFVRAGQPRRVPELVDSRESHPGARSRSRSTRPTRPGTARRWSTARIICPAIRRRHQCAAAADPGGFPNFGGVDDLTNFEAIQKGLRGPGG